MYKPEDIVEFIEKCYEINDFSYSSFRTVNDEDELVKIPMISNGKLNMDLVMQAAMELGVNVDALLEMNEDECWHVWSDKYPCIGEFIGRKGDFEMAKQNAYYDNFIPLDNDETIEDDIVDFDSVDPKRLLATIFGTDLRKLPSKRFGKDLHERLNKELLIVEDKMPGVFHYGESINDLVYHTEYFCHYTSINKMVLSFIEMISRAEELFFKTLDNELEEKEIREYNIIISALNLVDRVIPSKRMYYSHVYSLREMYKETGYDKFLSFAKQPIGMEFDPWTCKQFIEDRELVQLFINCIPEAKQMMMRFGQKTANLFCSFIWSDAPYKKFDSYALAADDDDGYYERTNIYIPKTKEELAGDEYYANIIKSYVKSSAMGGLSVPKIEVINPKEINLVDWLDAMKGGCNG